MTLTRTEHACLVRALAQGGRFYPTGLDSARTEVVKTQLQRNGYLTNGPGNMPCITDAGTLAVQQKPEGEQDH